MINLHHLIVLTNVLGDVYSSRAAMLETVAENAVRQMDISPTNHTQIPLANGKYALVSPEDYSTLMDMNVNWKVSSSGYPIYVKRLKTKSKTFYMHRLIKQTPCRHLNGNRLDNRRENLVPSYRNASKDTEDFLVKLPEEDAPIFDYRCPILKQTDGVVKVSYEDGRVYEGSVKKGIPHGYGELSAMNLKTVGEWADGVVRKGLNLHFHHTHVHKVELIIDNIIRVEEVPLEGDT